MQTIVERVTTERHVLWIVSGHYLAPDAYVVEFRPLNPKTGEPWQASHRVRLGADIEPEGYAGRGPQAYSSLELARQALAAQVAKLAR